MLTGPYTIPLRLSRRALAMAAADLLESSDWIQGIVWHPGREAIDILGALAFAGGATKAAMAEVRNPVLAVPPVNQFTVEETRELAEALVNEDLDVWNDARWRTKDEVVALLRRVAVYGSA